MKLNKLLVLTLSITILFTSCSNDDDNAAVLPKGDYENGVLISHEGNFGQGNASVSFVSYDLETVENNVYNNVNQSILGDTAQSMAFNNDLLYIILNVSNKIEVVNRYTFESVATIDTGLSNPRYMAVANGKGYVTNWGDFSDTTDDAVAVIDLATNTFIENIPVSYLPESIIAVGNKIYVATGIFGNGNVVDVISSLIDEVVDNITVGQSPDSFQLDSNQDLWVLSSENLIEINTNSDEIKQTLTFDDTITSPAKLNFDTGNFYFYSGGSVYKLGEAETSINTTAEITGVSFYDMSVKDGVLYGLDAGNFTDDGKLVVYDLDTNTETKSLTVNIIPGEVYFN